MRPEVAAMVRTAVRGKRSATKKSGQPLQQIRIRYGLGPITNKARPEEKSSGLAIS
jgi:hypothetical protein